MIRISTSFEEHFLNSHKAELTLKNARLQDDGEYTCVAEKYGKNKKEIRESFFIYVHHGNYHFFFVFHSVSYATFFTFKKNLMCIYYIYLSGIILFMYSSETSVQNKTK